MPCARSASVSPIRLSGYKYRPVPGMAKGGSEIMRRRDTTLGQAPTGWRAEPRGVIGIVRILIGGLKNMKNPSQTLKQLHFPHVLFMLPSIYHSWSGNRVKVCKSAVLFGKSPTPNSYLIPNPSANELALLSWFFWHFQQNDMGVRYVMNQDNPPAGVTQNGW
jgi:hypothetical protein